MHGEEVEVLGEIDVGQHLQNHINAPPIRQGLHFFQIRGGTMIENVLRALFGHELAPALRTRGSNHRHASSPTELHPGDTHSTAGPMHEERFAGRSMAAVKERLIGRSIGHKHGGPLGERRWFAERMYLLLFA